MAAQQRPVIGRRGASGAWGRLKTPPPDPLEVYGLPSKGETRLNDFKAQEAYYNKIVERYMKFCAAAGGGDELDRQFTSLSLDSTRPAHRNSSATTTTTTNPPRASSATLAPPTAPPLPSTDPAAPSVELQTIHTAMRKLRESITATSRTDVFAQRAYMFIVRAALLTNTPATYHPALLYLLQRIHPRTPLPAPELAEAARYHALDLACRAGDLHGARAAQVSGFGGVLRGCARTRRVLDALVRGDWVAFWRLRRGVDGYQRRILSWAEEGVRWHALKCVGRSYFGAQRRFVERAAGAEWEGLVAEGVGWELQADKEWVVIRRPKAKAAG